MTSLPDLEMFKAVEAERLHQIEVLKTAGVQDVMLTMVFQPIASGAIKACDAKGGNPMGLSAQNQSCKRPYSPHFPRISVRPSFRPAHHASD